MARKPRGQRVVDAYFSRHHFDERETCCPLIALPSDVMRGTDASYREVLEKLVEIFMDDLDEPQRREARTCACRPVRRRHRDAQMCRRSGDQPPLSGPGEMLV